jgi:hypothetical protein
MRVPRAVQIAATCLVLLCGVVLGAPAAQAFTESPVTLRLERLPNHAEAGWWIKGAVTDGGRWQTDFRAAGGGPASPTFEVEVKVTLHGSAGDIQMAFQGHFNAVRSLDFGGTWTITGGSGAYAHLQGNGTWTAEDLADGGLAFPCTGTVHTS